MMPFHSDYALVTLYALWIMNGVKSLNKELIGDFATYL